MKSTITKIFAKILVILLGTEIHARQTHPRTTEPRRWLELMQEHSREKNNRFRRSQHTINPSRRSIFRKITKILVNFEGFSRDFVYF